MKKCVVNFKSLNKCGKIVIFSSHKLQISAIAEKKKKSQIPSVSCGEISRISSISLCKYCQFCQPVIDLEMCRLFIDKHLIFQSLMVKKKSLISLVGH